MLRDSVKILCFSIVLLLFGSAKAQQPVDSGVVFTDPAAVILVKKDNPEFDIVLKSNPSTGYSWQCVERDNKNLFEWVSSEYIPPRKDGEMVGVSGYEKWTFKINQKLLTNSQTINVTMVYKRSWEKKNGKKQQYFIKVET